MSLETLMSESIYNPLAVRYPIGTVVLELRELQELEGVCC